MKYFNVYLMVLFLFCCQGIFAQNALSGRVTDSNGSAIEFANVMLYSLPDSAIVTGTITNAKGEFSLQVENIGDAFLQISFIGYETRTVPAKSQQIIVLQRENMQLSEVIVSGNLPRIRLRDDAIVITVQNSVLSKAGTANDVLKRLPSVTDDKGVYSVFGKGEAKIYINNRETRDVLELDNLNSSDISDVEIVNNPGARYDASVKAVIRITTVRKTGDGFSFDVRSSFWQSQNTDLREQLNINYRVKGWDVFGTFYYGRNAWVQESDLLLTTYADTLWRQENILNAKGTSFTVRGTAGVNYEISSKHYVGMKYIQTMFPTHKSFPTLNSTVFADNVFYDKWSSVEEEEVRNKPAHQLNAYYNGAFDDLKVDFNADFYTNRQCSQSHVTETSQEYDNRTVNSESNIDNRLIASKLILSYPVFGGQFSFGNEYTDTHRRDEYSNTENIVPSSNTTIKERNNSFFIEYSRTIPIGQLGVGLRYENVRSNYFSNEKKIEEQSRHYRQWFPNVSFNTQTKNVNLQISYTAKTQRPAYYQLSNNVYYANRFLRETGNPFLYPSVIHDVTLVGAWKFLQLMSSYKYEKDAVVFWVDHLKDNPAVTVFSYDNLEKRPSFSAYLTLSPTFRIWSPQLSGGFIKQWVTVISNGKSIALNKPMPVVSFKNSLNFPKEFILTLDVDYQGPGDFQNMYRSEHRLGVNIGFTKSFLDDRLRIELKGHDLFKGIKDGNLIYGNQMEFYQLNRYDSREFELTIRYKFNSAKSKYKGTGAGDKEINRL